MVIACVALPITCYATHSPIFTDCSWHFRSKWNSLRINDAVDHCIPVGDQSNGDMLSFKDPLRSTQTRFYKPILCLKKKVRPFTLQHYSTC